MAGSLTTQNLSPWILALANSRFPKEPRLRPLRHPEDATEAFCRLFAGAEPVRFENAGRSQAMQWIEHLFLKATAECAVVIYYNGYGLLKETGEVFLASAESGWPELASNAIPLSWIAELAGRSQAGRTVLILDCQYLSRPGAKEADASYHLAQLGETMTVLTAATFGAPNLMTGELLRVARRSPGQPLANWQAEAAYRLAAQGRPASELFGNGEAILSDGEPADKLGDYPLMRGFRRRGSLPGFRTGALAVAVRVTDHLLAAGGNDGTIQIYPPDSAKTTTDLRGGHQGAVRTLCFAAGGRRLVSGGADGNVVIWNTADWQIERSFPAHAGAVLALSPHESGRLVASAGAGGVVRIWDALSGQRKAGWATHDRVTHAVAFHPDGEHLATGGDSGTVLVWNVKTQEAQEWARHEGRIYSIDFDHGGVRLASGGADGLIKVAVDHGAVETFEAEGRRAVLAVRFDPNNYGLLAGSAGGGLMVIPVWHTAGARRLQTGLVSVESAAFTGDGRRFYCAGAGGAVQEWVRESKGGSHAR